MQLGLQFKRFSKYHPDYTNGENVSYKEKKEHLHVWTQFKCYCGRWKILFPGKLKEHNRATYMFLWSELVIIYTERWWS